MVAASQCAQHLWTTDKPGKLNTTMSTQTFRNHVPHKRACCQVGNSPRVVLYGEALAPKVNPLPSCLYTGFIQKIATTFLRTFQLLFKDHIRFSRIPTRIIISQKNAHSQSILIRLLGLNCLLCQGLYIFQLTCLKLIV